MPHTPCFVKRDHVRMEHEFIGRPAVTEMQVCLSFSTKYIVVDTAIQWVRSIPWFVSSFSMPESGPNPSKVLVNTKAPILTEDSPANVAVPAEHALHPVNQSMAVPM